MFVAVIWWDKIEFKLKLIVFCCLEQYNYVDNVDLDHTSWLIMFVLLILSCCSTTLTNKQTNSQRATSQYKQADPVDDVIR